MPVTSHAGLVLTSFSETPTWFEATYAFSPTPTPDLELNVGQYWTAEIDLVYNPALLFIPASFTMTWTGIHKGTDLLLTGPHGTELLGTNVIGVCNFPASTLNGVVCNQTQNTPHLDLALLSPDHMDVYDFDVSLVSGGGTVTFTGCHNNECGPVVPVPAAAWLLGSGILGLAAVARRKKSLIA
jgi:hypothetical protein